MSRVDEVVEQKLIMNPSRKLFFLVVLLLLASFACQSVAQVFENPLIPATEVAQHVLPLTYENQYTLFQELWSVVDEEYLYEDFNGVDWDATYTEYLEKIDAGLDAQEFYQAMKDMIFSLGDDHSIFLDPEEAAEEDAEYAGETNFVGIGIWVAAVAERDRAVILLVFPDSPAEKAGLQSHDSILFVEGEPILDEEGEMVDSILGLEGTPVTITVQTPGEEPRDLTITRARISGSLPVPYQLITTPKELRVGYILLPTFTDSTVDDRVTDALEDLSADGPLDGLILDNRINEGGFNTVMEGTLRLFVDGLMGYFVNREGEGDLTLTAKDVEGSTTIPLVVLIGLDTASFGEIFSGILKDQDRATLIGETTEGNVETLWGYDFDDGSRAWIAHDTFRPLNHPEADWEHSGIIPHIHAPSAWDMITFETDPAVHAALDFFDTLE
jgi:C-terminal peptidase prc